LKDKTHAWFLFEEEEEVEEIVEIENEDDIV
jgi:hypothetical protein